MKTLTLRKLSASFIIVLFSLSAVLPIALSKTYTEMPPRATITAVAASPTLIGLGQQVLINILTFPAPSGPTYYVQNALSNVTSAGFKNATCTITLPDGTKNTFMPIDMTLAASGYSIPGLYEDVGTLEFYYTPTQIGNYSVTASFPGQTYTTDNDYANMNLSVYYQPSVSTVAATFSVQKDPVLGGIINGFPWQELPNGYWTNPILTNNREWSAISGAWVASNYDWYTTPNYNPYTTSPRSPHILWASTPNNGTVAGAGIIGGQWGSLSYATATGGAGNIVLDGNIYQNDISGTTFECVSLRNGQVLWHATGQIQGAWRFRNIPSRENIINEATVGEFLLGSNSGAGLGGSQTGAGSTNWTLYSPNDGHIIRTLTNVPPDLIAIKYSDGSGIFWCIQANQNNWNTTIPLQLSYCNLICWNYSRLTTTATTNINNPTFNNVLSTNWLQGVQWNSSCILPTSSQVVSVGSNDFNVVNPYAFVGANVVVVCSHNADQMAEAFDMTTGKLLWVNNNTVIDLNGGQGIATDPNGPLIEDPAGQIVAYNVKTGQQMWTAPGGQLPWGLLPDMQPQFIYNNGTLYYGSYDGYVYAVNINTGKQIWKSDYTGASNEQIYGNPPYGQGGGSVGGGGVLYFDSSNIFGLEPRSRFQNIYAIDETTGHFLWTLPIDAKPTAIAYGYLVAVDGEDGIQYCIGKGLTSTTVSATPSVGSAVTIQGSVMDRSPGQPNTPAISDANMSVWMDYLYGQNATLINNPPTPMGVPVTLTALDPNGNSVNIGNVTSDASGQFGASFTPSMSGMYTIYATFGGSESYYSSYGETHLAVQGGASPSQSTNSAGSAATPDYTMTIVGTGIAVIIAVAVVGALMLRKK